MNAFLIFCKRHRAQVREKYPHLENRQVTKILGEWWADLPAHQKTSYTELARQYKEAFLRANPDFKWYKIPAQPPRPPPARPSNQKVPRATEPLPTDGAITFGKLADEAQMGGLSTLLSTALAATNSSNSGNNSSSGHFSLSSSSSPSIAHVTTPDNLTLQTTLTPSGLMGVTTNTHRHNSTTATTSMPSTSTSLGSLSPSVAAAWSGRGVSKHLHQRNGSASPSSPAQDRLSSFSKYSGFNGISGSIMTTAIGSSLSSSSNNLQPTDSASLTAAAMTPPRPPKKRYLHENQHHNSSASPPPVLGSNSLEIKPPDIDKNKACSALLQLSQASSPHEDKLFNNKSLSSSNWSSSSSSLSSLSSTSSSFPTLAAESRGFSSPANSNNSSSISGCDLSSSTSDSGSISNRSTVVWSNLSGAAEAARKSPVGNVVTPADTNTTAPGGRGHVRGGVEEGGGGGSNGGNRGGGGNRAAPLVYHTLENLQQQQQPPTSLADEQPLNLTTETTIKTSNKELINSIVDKMYNGQMPIRDRTSLPKFFKPDKVDNNNVDEKKGKEKVNEKGNEKGNGNGLTNKINGLTKPIDSDISTINCDMSTLVSRTIEVALNKGVNDEHEKVRLSREGCKGLFSQYNDNSFSKSTTTTNSDNEIVKESHINKDEQSKETVVTSTSINNSNNNSSSSNSFNMTGSGSFLGRGKKRNKEEEDGDSSQKKRREVHVVSQGRGSSNIGGRGSWRGSGGMVDVGRSRVQRACKGQRYEKLISEGVLQAPRRSKSRKAEDLDAPLSQDAEEDIDEEPVKDVSVPHLTQHYHQQQQQPQHHQQQHHQNQNQQEQQQEDPLPPMEEDPETLDDEVANLKTLQEDPISDAGNRRNEESNRRGRKQLRRLRPDDFDLEARIEALPKLNLDDFTRRKKERKRTTSASTASTHSSLQNTSNSSSSHPSPHSTQVTAGVVSSSSRVSAIADSTSDPHTALPPSHQYNTQSPLVTGSGSCNVPPSVYNGNSVSSSSSSSSSSNSNSNRNGVVGSGCHLSDGDSTTSTSTAFSGISSHNNGLAGSSSNIHNPHVNGGSPGLAIVAEHNTNSGNPSSSSSTVTEPLIGSQKRKARKQTITRHDPMHSTLNRTSVVEPDMLSRINLVALAEVALSQPSMKP